MGDDGLVRKCGSCELFKGSAAAGGADDAL